MKKILITSTSILIILTLAFVYSALNLKIESEKVNYKLDTLYGDVSELDEVKVKYESKLNNTMLWESDIEFTDGKLYADIDYKNDFFTEEKYHYLRNIGAELDSGEIVWDIVEDKPDSKSAKEYRLLEAGKIDEFEVDIKDYYEYYPINIAISVPKSNNFWSWDANSFIERLDRDLPDEQDRTLEGFLNVNLRERDYLLYKILNIYRIPLEDKCIIKAGRVNGKGNNNNTIEFENPIHIGLEYINGKDRDYFWLNVYSENREITVPEGLKIKRSLYSIGIKNGNYDADSIKPIYEVESGEEILRACLSSDNSDIRLVCEKKGEVFLLILDAETGEIKQREHLASQGDKEYINGEIYIDVISRRGQMADNDSEEFIGINISEKRIKVFVRDEEGRYKKEIETEISPTVETAADRLFFSPQYAYAYKSGRLIIATDTYGNLYDGGATYIGVYDKDGLRYYGTISSSLAKSAFAHGGELNLYDVRLSLRK